MGWMLFDQRSLQLSGLQKYALCLDPSLISSSINFRRIWIISGYILSSRERDSEALECLTNAMEVLLWGRRELQNEENPGVIFDRTFVRGVQALHLAIAAKVIWSITRKPDHD
jgi:hypothetical protein